MATLTAFILAHGLFSSPTVLSSSMELSVAALAAVDVGQTEWALTHYVKIPSTNPAYKFGLAHPYESNPILGAHPSREKLFGLAGAALVGHALVAWALPTPYREIWQYLGISVEGAMVFQNALVGVNFNMSF